MKVKIKRISVLVKLKPFNWPQINFILQYPLREFLKISIEEDSQGFKSFVKKIFIPYRAVKFK